MSLLDRQSVVTGEPGGGKVIDLHPMGGGGFGFSCDVCPFIGTYGTRQGAIQRITEHFFQVHNIRLMWKGL